MNLPSYDPDLLENISDMEAPQVFADFYPLYIAIMEGVKLLSEKTEEPEAIRENMSPESKTQLAELVHDMELFSNLKFRCDRLFAPYHQYINVNQIAFTEENVDKLYSHLRN